MFRKAAAPLPEPATSNNGSNRRASRRPTLSWPLSLAFVVLLAVFFLYDSSVCCFSDDLIMDREMVVKTTAPAAAVPSPQLDLAATLAQHKASIVYMGNNANTGWYVDKLCLMAPRQKKRPIIVYGVGAGEDISWDLGMIDSFGAFGATVSLFDPTEKSIRYTAPLLKKYERLTHTHEGLAARPGNLTFALPANAWTRAHVSMRQQDLADTDMTRRVSVPVNSLRNWMKERKHTYLDILKINIEGSEYPVLEDLVAADFLPFTQLLVEWHDRFLPADEKARHPAILQKLQDKGFHLLWLANGGQEVGFVKIADLAYCQDGVSPRHAGSAP
jgi:FkbM family methyltransferase